MADITLDEAKKEASLLRNQLDKWADAYYSKDAPEVEDNVYDQKYSRLLELEKQFPEIVTPDSITQRVGGEIDSQTLLKLNMLSRCFRWGMFSQKMS